MARGKGRGSCGNTPKRDGSGKGIGNRSNRAPTRKKSTKNRKN